MEDQHDGESPRKRAGMDTEEDKKGMEKNTYKAEIWQYDIEPLLYAIWSDNNLIQTLSNFQTPEVVD